MSVVCQACGHRYDYSQDNFCPRCGAYNRPDRTRQMAGPTSGGTPSSKTSFSIPKGKKVRRPAPDAAQQAGRTLVLTVGIIILMAMVLPLVLSACHMLQVMEQVSRFPW